MAWQQHKCTMAFSMQPQQSFCFIRLPSNHRQHRRRPPNKQPRARAYMPRSGHLAADLLGRPCPRGRATRAVQAAVSANSNGSEFIRAKNNTIQDTKLPRCKFSLHLISRSLGIRSVQCLILIFVVKSREGKFFEVEMTVRDCELDKYGVVSSAVLAAYMETGQLRPSSNSCYIRDGRLGCLCRVSC